MPYYLTRFINMFVSSNRDLRLNDKGVHIEQEGVIVIYGFIRVGIYIDVDNDAFLRSIYSSLESKVFSDYRNLKILLYCRLFPNDGNPQSYSTMRD